MALQSSESVVRCPGKTVRGGAMNRFKRHVWKPGITAIAAMVPLLATPLPLADQPVAGVIAAASTDARRCHALAGRIVAGAVIKDAALQPSTPSASAPCIVNGALHDTLGFRISLPA